MKLISHKDIPAKDLRALQKAVDAVIAARSAYEEFKTCSTRASKEVPKQAPSDKAKLAEWERLRDQRESEALVEKHTLPAQLTHLKTVNTALRAAIEKFRQVAEALYTHRESEAGRCAALNVLRADALCVEVEDFVNHEKRKNGSSLLDRLILEQAFKANRRHFTIRLRVGSAKWSYVQNRDGDQGEHKPSVPCLTYGEAERLCSQRGELLAKDPFSKPLGFEVQCYDLVAKKHHGQASSCSIGLMPKAED